eukprot:CAMPEP_0205917664 /NCGR_PEP_ID=MMETSP1325-20131115/9307_1 /ASSEMBLY_ACC=CAM_ASM_000708 /TAXON_ID=236786 /ORGANISM="Florenciella sp., Strain RCC1007" /LENGTH=125 /DNA_ID=CAMNT_0053285107 /DNA_START=257 /DNA_END=638 /DNA_ORIENTATION=-
MDRLARAREGAAVERDMKEPCKTVRRSARSDHCEYTTRRAGKNVYGGRVGSQSLVAGTSQLLSSHQSTYDAHEKPPLKCREDLFFGTPADIARTSPSIMLLSGLCLPGVCEDGVDGIVMVDRELP